MCLSLLRTMVHVCGTKSKINLGHREMWGMSEVYLTLDIFFYSLVEYKIHNAGNSEPGNLRLKRQDQNPVL